MKPLDNEAVIRLLLGNQAFQTDKINEWKSKIVAYIKQNRSTGIELAAMGSKEFGNSLVSFAGKNPRHTGQTLSSSNEHPRLRVPPQPFII